MDKNEMLEESLRWIDAMMNEIEHPAVANFVWLKDNRENFLHFRHRLMDTITYTKRKAKPKVDVAIE